MIDTVKFKVPVTDKIIDAIKSFGFEKTVEDKYYGFKEYTKIFDRIRIPPYNSELIISSSEHLPNYYFIEGNLPKALYGENVHLLYPSQLEAVLRTIYSSCLKRYENFVSYEYWTLQRLDMCYAWKFELTPSKNQIEFLKTLEYPRKGFHKYPTSVMYSSRVATPKFYLKHPEFVKKQYKQLIKDGFVEIADSAKDQSIGLLRYEVELHKPYLNQLFGKEATYKDILDNQLFYDCLNRHLSTLLGTTNRNCMNSKQALCVLEKSCDKKTTKTLFTFISLFRLNNPHVEYFVKQYFDPTTIKRNLNKLTELGIGPVVDEFDPSMFDLSIPSVRVVNSDKPVPAAGGAGLSG